MKSDAGFSLMLHVLAVYALAAFALVTAATLFYPYQITWLEGAVMESVFRVVAAKELYSPPSLEYLPLMYTPFFYHAAAMLAHLFGETLFAPRLLSLLSVAACCWVMLLWGRHEGLQKHHRWLGVALFLMGVSLAQFVYAAVRVDSLFLALAFGGLYLACCTSGLRSAAAAGVLFALAALTKQQAVLLCAPVVLAGFFLWPKRALVMTFVAAALTVATIIYYQQKEPWFYYYVWQMPADLPKLYDQLGAIIMREWLAHFTPAMLLAAGMLWRLKQVDKAKCVLYSALLMGAFITCIVSFMQNAAAQNVLMPGILLMSLLAALAAGFFDQAAGRVKLACQLLLIAQFCLWLYNPFEAIPTQQERQIADQFVAYVKNVEGEVLVPNAPYIARLAGKTPYSYRDFGMDIYQSTPKGGEPYKILANEIINAFKEKRFAAIFLSKSASLPLKDRYYRFKETATADTQTLSAMKLEFLPMLVYVPTEEPPAP